LATNNCGSYSRAWKYRGVDNSDGHLLDFATDFMKVNEETGSITVS
jgi:hypothetical protein